MKIRKPDSEEFEKKFQLFSIDQVPVLKIKNNEKLLENLRRNEKSLFEWPAPQGCRLS